MARLSARRNPKRTTAFFGAGILGGVVLGGGSSFGLTARTRLSNTQSMLAVGGVGATSIAASVLARNTVFGTLTPALAGAGVGLSIGAATGSVLGAVRDAGDQIGDGVVTR